MRYADILNFDISNGEDVGVALFVQGCSHHCFNCFNPETWAFDGGKYFSQKIYLEFLNMLRKPQIKRLSILGGEPFDAINDTNDDIISLLLDLKINGELQNKKVWIYSGYTYEEIISNNDKLKLLKMCDILIDGEYKDDLRNLTLKWRGSSNQRVIDIQKSLKEQKVILYCD